jgi:hypothetical protein
MASEEALKQARAIVDDLIASDSHVYIPISLYEPFVERIAAAIDGPPATAEKCVKCGHSGWLDVRGFCHMTVGAEVIDPRQCGCKCEFDAPTSAGPADLISRSEAESVAIEFGTAAYKELQKNFTSKSRQELRVMQDVADDIAKAIHELPALPAARPAPDLEAVAQKAAGRVAVAFDLSGDHDADVLYDIILEELKKGAQ